MSDEMESNVTRGDHTTDEISLRTYAETLSRYRQVIGAVVGGIMALFVLIAIAALLFLPSERVGVLQFRLLFEGASLNQYPNGTTFSPTEIVSAPVLTAVYEANDLARFETYEDFKGSVFILSSNPQVDLLTYEYQAKLADTRLIPVDRARLEEEFRRKRESLTDPVYSLNLRQRRRSTAMPRELVQKALHDTLATWAAHADERKGATRFAVPVLSKNILQRDVIEREDYLVAVDILRAKTNRVIETIDTLAELPGAQVIRTAKERISLAEVRANLEDVVRFKLEPLLDLVRSEGVTKNGRELSLYANNQLFQLRMEREKARSMVGALQNSLNAYMAQHVERAPERAAGRGESPAAPSSGRGVQLEPSFLDRLMTLSTADRDQSYRQSLTERIIGESERAGTVEREAAFYQDLVSNLKNVDSRGAGSPVATKLINARTTEAFDEVARAVDQLSELYRELTVQNLNPSTTLYAVTGPFIFRVAQPLTVRAVGLYFLLVLVLALIVTPIGCLLHDALRRRAGPEPIAAS